MEQVKLNVSEVQGKILKLLTPAEQENFTPLDQIYSWIDKNIAEQITEPVFIRSLSQAVLRSAIYELNSRWKINTTLLQKYCKILQKYIDNKDLELQCLFAAQSLVHKLWHPQNLLLQVFQVLWDEGVVTTESFIRWESNKDPEEMSGKAVAEMSVAPFLADLKEVDDDNSSSYDED